MHHYFSSSVIKATKKISKQTSIKDVFSSFKSKKVESKSENEGSVSVQVAKPDTVILDDNMIETDSVTKMEGSEEHSCGDFEGFESKPAEKTVGQDDKKEEEFEGFPSAKRTRLEGPPR